MGFDFWGGLGVVGFDCEYTHKVKMIGVCIGFRVDSLVHESTHTGFR